MNKFWNWKQAENNQERTLFIHGAIASESWYDDEVTPQIFRNELLSESGNITLWINSLGEWLIEFVFLNWCFNLL